MSNSITNPPINFTQLGYSCNTNNIGKVTNNFSAYEYASYDKINTIPCESLLSTPTKTLNNILCTNSEQSVLCKSAFDNSFLYSSNNPLVIKGNDINYSIKNNITDPTMIYTLGKNNSSILAKIANIDPQYYDPTDNIQMQTAFNIILQETPLKAGCCLRTQNDFGPQTINVYTQNSPYNTPTPTIPAPTTSAPTTSAPTTSAPTTFSPTTFSPTTFAPTTDVPRYTPLPTNSISATSSPNTSVPTIIPTKPVITNNLGFSLSPITIPPNTCPIDLYVGSPKCNAFYDVYCTNVISYFNNNNLSYDQLAYYAPQCACYFPITSEQKIYPPSTPAKCFKKDCNSENYLDYSSRNKICSLGVCNTIMQANNITSLKNPNIDPIILQNCGNYIPNGIAIEMESVKIETIITEAPTITVPPPTSDFNSTMIIITIIGIILIALYFFIM